MHMKRLFCLPIVTSALLLLTAACTPEHQREEALENLQPAGRLTHVLDMVDRDGRTYGKVELDPVGGGRVYDADGRIIGQIVTPDHYVTEHYVPDHYVR